MVTLQQNGRGARKRKIRKTRSQILCGCPHRRGYCIKLDIVKPKKPNSAKRKIVKIKLKGHKGTKRKRVIAYIPGIGHNVQKNMDVLIRGGRVPDLPGVRYHIMRKKLDFQGGEKIDRKRKRSKYGYKLERKKLVSETKETEKV